MVVVFLATGLLVVNAKAADFCHSLEVFPLNEQIETMLKSIADIQKSDAVASPEQQVRLAQALKVLSMSKDVDQQTTQILGVASVDLKKTFTKIENAIDKNVKTSDELHKELKAAVDQAYAKLTELVSGFGNLNAATALSTRQQAQNQVLLLQSNTAFFAQLKILIDHLKNKLQTTCPDDSHFSFTTTLGDGKKLVFSDCLDTLQDNQDSDTWGGPVQPGSCRNILDCNTAEEKTAKDFRGFGYQWVIECKQENGKCPMASVCAQRIDGGGSGQISKPKPGEDARVMQ